MVIGIPDTRPLLTKIIPNVPFCGLNNNIIDSLRNKLSEATGWTPLVGNTNSDRWYYPELEKDIDLYKYIKNAVKWYLSEIKVKYPALNISSLGLIRSAPLARSQYDGFSHRLHSDYPPNVNVLDLPLRPLLMMLISIMLPPKLKLFWSPLSINSSSSELISDLVLPVPLLTL